MDELVQFLREQLDEDGRVAREASGSTVVGEPGNWKPSPAGDEWEVNRDDGYADELLVALRPGLARPPEVLGGYWGVVVGYRWESDEPGMSAPLAEYRHAARHDPARVLREIDAKRQALDHYETVRNHARDHEAYALAEGAVRKQIQIMALPYADRPGYKEGWRP